ncbi:hypothetical protein SteCoe_7551 [Stentor coeruleus]|uniref:Uncharacterized protein n=1 Tax=Stentor coeruleus TaxID=5963 RepID=A0A1R2CMB4_9CILI|nr:hypothetical protein SteCoe_7551 [Stentor coeruleus]
MEKICSIAGCQTLAEIICQCKQEIFCDYHTSSHVTTEGNHSIQRLRVEIPPGKKSKLLKHLKKYSLMIQETRSKLRENGKRIINKIYQDINNCDKKLQILQEQVFNHIIHYSKVIKIMKSSDNYMDKLLLSSKENIKNESFTWTIPSVDSSIKTFDEFFTLKGEAIPFSYYSSEKRNKLLSTLKSVNNKIALHMLAQETIKSDSESQKILLDIIKNSANKKEYESIAWKAFTILSKIAYNFSGLNLQGINIQNAEMIGGKFIDTDFRNANFKQVKINYQVFSEAVINIHVLKGIEMGKNNFEGHRKNISCMKFSQDGRILVTGSEDLTIRVWDLKTGHCYIILEGHVDLIFSLDISSNSSEIISGGKEGVVKLWDTTTGTCQGNYRINTDGIVSTVTCISFANEYIIATSMNREILGWSKDGSLIFNCLIANAIFSLALPLLPNPDNSWNIFVGTRQGELILFKSNNSNKPYWIQKNSHTQTISSISVSENSKHLITAGVDDKIRIWKQSVSRLFNQQNYIMVKEITAGCWGFLYSKMFSGSEMLAVKGQQTIKLFNRKTLNLIGSLEREKEILSMDILSDGSMIAYSEGSVVIFKKTSELLKFN